MRKLLELADRHATVPIAIVVTPLAASICASLLGLPIQPGTLSATTIWAVGGVACYVLLMASVGITKRWVPAHFAAVGMFFGGTFGLGVLAVRDFGVIAIIAAYLSAIALGGGFFGAAAIIRNAVFPYRH